jgi:hypothetical protein
MAEHKLTFDASHKRMTIEFHEPPALETLKTIAEHLKKNEARSLHAMVADEWSDPDAPDWDDPRHVSQLEKALPPSLESFIFDMPVETVSRQAYNTVGDFCDVLAACPMLTRAFLTGCSQMRKTRHAHLRELYLMGNPLDPSIISGLAASQFPALEKLVLKGVPGIDEFHEYPEHTISQYPALRSQVDKAVSQMEELAACLRAIEAPGVEVYIDCEPVLRFLTIIGRAALPCNLCVRHTHFDDVDGLLGVIQQHDALRSGKLRLDSEKFFDSEVAQLKELGVTLEDSTHLFSPSAYDDW